MSVINKKPLIEKVVSALSPEQKKNLLKGLNGELTKSVKVFDNLSTSDKGISYVDIKFADGVKTGYLVYNDAVSVLIAYYNDTQKMTLFVLDVPKHTYKASREYLTIDELRRIVGLELVEVGENIKIQVGDIDSGSQTANKIIVSDGEGGASWGSVIDVIENSGVQDGSAQYLIGIDSNGDVVKDEIPEGIVVDQTIVEDSTNAVSGGAVYDALELKANSSDVYTKAAADELLDGKASITALENGTIVPAKSLVTEQLENVSEDSGTTQDAPFVFQATATDGGGGASDTAPTAKYLKLKGRTYAFNQLNNNAQISSSGTTVNDVLFTKNDDGSITMNGTASGTINQNILTNIGIQGHIYLIRGAYGGSDSTYWLRNDNKTSSQYCDFGNGSIIEWTQSFKWTLQIHIESGTVLNNVKIYPQVIDLTQLVNGNTDYLNLFVNGVVLSDYDLTFTGVDIFNQLFPLPYYAYNAGTLVSANATLLTTLGKNQFDGVIEGGALGSDCEEVASSNGFRSKNYIQVIPNQKYIFDIANAGTNSISNWMVAEYDGNKNGIIRQVKYSNKSVFQVSSNTHYIRFSCYTSATSVLTGMSIQFFLAWLENGTTSKPDFEECIKHEYQLGSELKDNPLLSAGSVCDEKTPDGTITRMVGSVDLGTIDGWSNYGTGGATERVITNALSSLIKSVSSSSKANLTSSRFIAITYASLYSGNNGIALDGTSLYIKDPLIIGKTTNAEIKAALSGVYLYYELATPTTTQGTPFPTVVEVDDMGTMGYGGTSYNDYPQGCEFFYPADYVLFIDSLGNTCDFDASKFALKENLSTAFASFMQSISGYDASKTQTLKNIEGTLTWVDDE